MEPTYTLLGGDGKNYGPISLEQFRDWVREGRAGADTQVWRSDQTAWVTAADLPELGVPNVVAVPAAHATPAPLAALVLTNNPALEQQLKSGAGWFYWIAALSLVNTIATFGGWNFKFAIGLSIRQFIATHARNLGGSWAHVAIVLELLAAGLVILFGVFGNRRHLWAFIAGMALMGLDTALTVQLQLWLSLAFHVFALFCIFKGYQACRALRG